VRHVVAHSMALSTWLGSSDALVQAEPDDTAMSFIFIISDSPSTYSKDMFSVLASRSAGWR